MENRRSRMTKQMLKGALTELLEEEELKSISVRMICEKADLNRSTFYLHYETIDDLLKEYTEEYMSRIWDSTSGILQESDYRHILEYIFENPYPYRTLLKSGLYHRYIMEQYDKLNISDNPSFAGMKHNAFMLVSAFTIPGIEQMILYILEHPELKYTPETVAEVIYRLNKNAQKEIRRLSANR